MPDLEPTEPAETADIPEASTEEPTETVESETYTIKVDGEEQSVTLEELRSGYQRQADYTRKTQELASERQRLQQAEAIASALESDPAGTISALSNAFGVADTPSGLESSDSWDEMDPTEQRIAKIESQLEAQAAAARQQAIDKEVVGLKSRYGDFDEQALFQHALANQIPNLDAAYTHMKFGEVAAAAAAAQADKGVTEAKREAAPVEGGKTVQTGAVVSNNAGNQAGSIREAFALAKKQLSST